jgi:LysR family glycine cleavage system transcriptional activator
MRRKIPSLQALACFDAAARHESYTRAAQELALTQSAVSRQISTLEDFLGLPLFRRTRHGVVLTDAGNQYARQIAPRLQALERDTLDAMSGQGTGGAINLAAVPTFATRWLIPRLPDFGRSHPDVVVHIETRTRPFMFSDTVFDAAIYAGTPMQMHQWAGTRATALVPEVVIAVCAPTLLGSQRFLDASAVAALPLLQQSTRPEAWRQWFAAAGVVDAVAQPVALAGPRFEQFSMTAAAAVAGMGVALVPRLLIGAELARGELVVANPLPVPGERHYYLVHPEGIEVRPSLRGFASWLSELCQTAADSA